MPPQLQHYDEIDSAAAAGPEPGLTRDSTCGWLQHTRQHGSNMCSTLLTLLLLLQGRSQV
jgi:hypothetical protein